MSTRLATAWLPVDYILIEKEGFWHSTWPCGNQPSCCLTYITWYRSLRPVSSYHIRRDTVEAFIEWALDLAYIGKCVCIAVHKIIALGSGRCLVRYILERIDAEEMGVTTVSTEDGWLDNKLATSYLVSLVSYGTLLDIFVTADHGVSRQSLLKHCSRKSTRAFLFARERERNYKESYASLPG
jgi:hypothetical protein